MFVALKSGLAAKVQFSGIAKELCKRNNVLKYQVATLTRAANRDENEVPLIKPYPYHEKPYTVFNMITDTHRCRVHKHSKLIVIDGQVASGKTKLAKELAKEFDFLFIPQPTFDDLLVSPWGFDFRQLDAKLPRDAQSYDIERFCQDPFHWNVAAMQNYMFMMRQSFWMDSLAHILMTGQGVVTVRSPWTDAVFQKAMFKNKYISPKAYELLTDVGLATLHFYLKPHLIIYLDVPVEDTLQNIKKRGRPYEQNSKALTDQYLSDIEESYKRDYLARISEHSLLLIYDWSKGGDTEVVVSDIEGLNFDDYEENDRKLLDWRFYGFDYKLRAKHFTFDHDMILNNMYIVRTDVPEMWMSGNDLDTWHNLYEKHPDYAYAKGYNPLKGDKMTDIMLKCKKTYYPPERVVPLIEKYYERKERLKAARA